MPDDISSGGDPRRRKRAKLDLSLQLSEMVMKSVVTKRLGVHEAVSAVVATLVAVVVSALKEDTAKKRRMAYDVVALEIEMDFIQTRAPNGPSIKELIAVFGSPMEMLDKVKKFSEASGATLDATQLAEFDRLREHYEKEMKN